MKLLGLDVGKRRTGLAFADDSGVAVALDTFQHTSEDELIEHVKKISAQRGIDIFVLGLPLLPSGDEGSQVQFVRHVGEKLASHGLIVEYLDERYSTLNLRDPIAREVDADSASACQILQVFIDRNPKFDNNAK